MFLIKQQLLHLKAPFDETNIVDHRLIYIHLLDWIISPTCNKTFKRWKSNWALLGMVGIPETNSTVGVGALPSTEGILIGTKLVERKYSKYRI